MTEQQYRQLFKEIVRAYYEDVFSEKIEELMRDEKVDKNVFAKIISSICGVDVEYSERFSQDLKEAIENYKFSHRVVIDTHSCVKDCIEIEGKVICKNACPFDAIIIDKKSSLPKINIQDCVNCGICVDLCERKNFVDKIEYLPLAKILKENKKVVAAVAPAIAGQFGEDVTMGQIRAGLKSLGFVDMVEVAFFADMLTLKEAVEFDRFVSNKKDFMLSSCCCPIWVGMIKGKYKELIKYTTPSISPMIAAGRIIKKIDPECKVVFIGPCVAKKAEAKQEDIKGAIDYVLTFTELKDIFDALDIRLEEMYEELSPQYSAKGGRIYGRIGGVSMAIEDAIKQMFPKKAHLFTSKQASGIKECKKTLEEVLNGEIKERFLEGMGCDGGCIGGPKALLSKEKGKIMIENYGNESKIKYSSKNDIMMKFLKNIGIENIKDFKDKEKIKIFERNF